MLKKIKLLGTLLILALVLGGVSMCSDRENREAYKEGYEEGYDAARKTQSPAFKKGYQIGAAAGEKFHSNFVTLHLFPDDYGKYTETVLNTKSGVDVPLSMRTVLVYLGSKTNPLEWLRNILIIIYVLCFLCFIILLIRFISSLKSGEIFNRGNERKLNWMGILFLVIYMVGWGLNGLNYAYAKSAVALENYTVMMDRMSVSPLITGIVFLLFAQIFAMGRNMKEDQEFMV
jgi:hypothetical protein